MSSTPYLAGIFIYPIKSLDGVAVTRSLILAGGALQHDRKLALFDEQGEFVNGKRHAQIHRLRSGFDWDSKILSLRIQGSDPQVVFQIDKERSELEAWLSDYFGFPVSIRQNEAGGFPDDTNAPGPTIISTGTLETIASWFPELSVAEVRSRFRANLEIAGVPPFWEDQLFAEADQTVPFRVGEVQFEGINPCQRCVVVTRDVQTGEALPQFQRQFVTQRKAVLPSWTAASRFNHFFRLGVNTRVPSSEAGKELQVGDRIELMPSNHL